MTSKLQNQSTVEKKNITSDRSNGINSFSNFTKSIKKIKRLRSIVGVQPVSYVVASSDRSPDLMQYYLDRFVSEFAKDIYGYCLEFQADGYAVAKDNITKLDILRFEESNPQATRLSEQLNQLPSSTFDCIICPYVLHIISDLKQVVSELHRILKPGGVLLVAAPHISLRDRDREFWRFTLEGLQLLLEKDFGTQSVTTRFYGNSLTAVGVVRGLVANEFTDSELNYHDLRFAPVVCARAIKQTPIKSSTQAIPEETTTPPDSSTETGLRELLANFVTPSIYSQLKNVYRFYRRLSLQIGAPIARTRLAVGLEPLSYILGYDRGPDLMRYHLENQFFPEYAGDIRGHCLEFEEILYSSWFNREGVTKIDVLHVDESNPRATLVADLTKPNNLPSNTFDCIICTYVLHVIFDVEKAIAELHRILKPGGVLLVAVPQISIRDYEHEIWRFTPEGLQLLLEKDFGIENATVRAYGNSLIAAAAIRGLVVDEFTRSELVYSDPRFAPVVCARAIKQS